MNRRLLANLLISTFLILSISGLMMYFFPFQKNIVTIHTTLAFVFLIWVVFHVINNKTPLFRYIKGSQYKNIKRFLGLVTALGLALITIGLYFEIPYLSSIYTFGNELRNSQLGKKEQAFDYEIIELTNKTGAQRILLELKKGKAFKYPLFVFWSEDMQGNYLETLYISRVISSSTFDFGKKIGDKWQADIVRRPESLPYWSHKRGIKAEDGLYMPLNNSSDIDSVSGATPTGNFVINTQSDYSTKSYRILLELNQSYDWNDYYTKVKFPEDDVYSGSGQVGQPSLIYQAVNDLTQKIFLMKLIGHGHHSGKNGELYSDLSKITTAKDIADRIIVSFIN